MAAIGRRTRGDHQRILRCAEAAFTHITPGSICDNVAITIEMMIDRANSRVTKSRSSAVSVPQPSFLNSTLCWFPWTVLDQRA